MKKSIFTAIILSTLTIVPYKGQSNGCKALLLEWRASHSHLEESRWLTEYVINYFCITYETYFQDLDRGSIPIEDILGSALWAEWDIIHAKELYKNLSNSPWRQRFEAERSKILDNKITKIMKAFNETNLSLDMH